MRNSTPVFSSAFLTSESVDVREPISPSKLSIRRMVLMATPDLAASCVCSEPTSADATEGIVFAVHPGDGVEVGKLPDEKNQEQRQGAGIDAMARGRVAEA